jgi:choline-sulfatase
VDQKRVLPIDGKSVIPLMEGERDRNRTIFAEIHSGGVTIACFMVRQADFKYIHTTGYAPQLYDLAKDPKEWNNLAGQPEYQEVERKLHALLVANFDPDQIERDVQESLARRRLLKGAMDATGLPNWDYQPFFDATKKYWRKG